MATRIGLSLFGFIIVAIALPLMRSLCALYETEEMYRVYVAYCAFLMLIWNVLVFGTNIIVR